MEADNLNCMSMIEKDIQSLGLNEKEAKVYLASLELGQATVQKISAKAGIKRPTTYFIIENLMERGLMSSYYQGKKQLFMAEMPERILDLIAKERKELELREEQFKRLLPELQSINNRNKDKPVVKYYEGKEGVITMVSEHIKSNKGQDVYAVFSRDVIEDFMEKNDLDKIREDRVGNNVKVRAIYSRDKGDILDMKNAEIIRLPSKDLSVTCDIALFEDKVRITSFLDRLIGIVIEDKEIAKSMRAIFELAWKWTKYEQSLKEKK